MLAACAHQPKLEQSVRVIGTGPTYEAAKQNGFRDAIELKVGTMVLSERETVNYRQSRDEILVYSSGFVDEFKVISKVESKDKVYVTMDVLVSPTKLSNRLLNSTRAVQSFDGPRHLAQVSTIQESRLQATKMMSSVLNEYPKRAYQLQQKPYKLSVENNKTILSVGYSLKFDYNWLQSVNAAMLKFSDGSSTLNNVMGTPRSQAQATIFSKNPKAVLIGETAHYNFSNTANFEALRNSFYDGNEVRIRMVFLDGNNKIIHNSCWAPTFITQRNNTGSFYGSVDLNKFVVWGNSYEDAKILVSIPPQMLNAIHNIELSVTSNGECGG
jgi:hypothetical protein